MKKSYLEDGFVQVPKIVFHDKKVSSGELKNIYSPCEATETTMTFLGCFPGTGDDLEEKLDLLKRQSLNTLKALKLLRRHVRN